MSQPDTDPVIANWIQARPRRTDRRTFMFMLDLSRVAQPAFDVLRFATTAASIFSIFTEFDAGNKRTTRLLAASFCPGF